MYEKGKIPRLSDKGKGYHHSPKETHKVHGGEYAGTKELEVGSHPGVTARRVKPMRARESIERDSGKTTSKTPKGMKYYSEE